MDAAGNASVVWDASDSASEYVDIVTASRTSGWSAAAPVNGSLDASHSDLAVVPDGAATVVWERYDDGVTMAVVEAVSRTSAADAFGAAQIISDSAYPARAPVVGVNASGAAAAAWAQPTVADHSVIRAVTRPAGGGWGTPQPVSNAPDTTLERDEVGAAKIVVDGPEHPRCCGSVPSDPTATPRATCTPRGHF